MEYIVNGKNYKRAYRRHKRFVKFNNRTNVWIQSITVLYGESGELVSHGEKKKEILDGKSHNFLRTTGNPCNCYGCSGMFKYKRTPKQYRFIECESET